MARAGLWVSHCSEDEQVVEVMVLNRFPSITSWALKMRSDVVKKGIGRAPHRALLKALGLTEREIEFALHRRSEQLHNLGAGAHTP
jgi:hypothetical protein